MRVLIHADGGENVGLGHISRSLTLANTFAQHRHKVILTVAADLQNIVESVRHKAVTICITNSPADVAQLADTYNFDCLIIDSYRWTPQDVRAIRVSGFTVAFDDEGKNDLPVNILVNGSPGAANLNYSQFSAKLKLTGLRYQIVRDAFRLQRPIATNEVVNRVIALSGGCSDPNLMKGLCLLLHRYTQRFKGKVNADLISGPFSDKAEFGGLNGVKVLRNPDDLSQRVLNSDIAISAGGQTLFELACCGIPTIGFSLSSDQDANVSGMDELGLIINVGSYPAPNFFTMLEDRLISLSQDVNLRREMSVNSRRSVDGCGNERLVAELCEYHRSGYASSDE